MCTQIAHKMALHNIKTLESPHTTQQQHQLVCFFAWDGSRLSVCCLHQRVWRFSEALPQYASHGSRVHGAEQGQHITAQVESSQRDHSKSTPCLDQRVLLCLAGQGDRSHCCWANDTKGRKPTTHTQLAVRVRQNISRRVQLARLYLLLRPVEASVLRWALEKLHGRGPGVHDYVQHQAPSRSERGEEKR